jgi:hypothetical protein
MNPLGLIQAALVALEGVVRAVTHKPRKETRGERIGFWIVYALFLFTGFGAIIWTVYDLYIRK